MDQVPRDQIGYMQVQLRIYHNGDFYEEFAINAYDEYHVVKTELITSENKVIDDPANDSSKMVQIIIKVIEFDYTIALLMPVHQSEEWEVMKPSEEFTVSFYCILGELVGHALNKVTLSLHVQRMQ